MEFFEHLSAKYGYEYISTVEEFRTTLKYRDKIGPYWKSDGIGFDHLERVVMGSDYEKESPFTRVNSYIVAKGKNGKLNFLGFDYFEIELENGSKIILSSCVKPIITSGDECLYKTNIKGEKYVKDVIFSKGNNLIGYNFLTRQTFTKEGIGKCVKAFRDKLMILHDGDLSIYRIVEERDGIDYIDKTWIEKCDEFYSDEKEIVKCSSVNTEISKSDTFGYMESMHNEIYKLDFKDKTSRLLIVNGDDEFTLTDYYRALKFRKPYIYPPLDNRGNSSAEYICPDMGLTFNFTGENGEKLEMLLDENLKTHHRTRILNLNDRGE